MDKKVYDVEGIFKITITKTVKAETEEEALRLVEKYTEDIGNYGDYICVEGEGEELNYPYDVPVEWTGAKELDEDDPDYDDYDTETE